MRKMSSLLAVLVAAAACARAFPTNPPRANGAAWQAFRDYADRVGQIWPEDRIVVHAVAGSENGQPVLQMLLINTSTTPLKFYRSVLPWGSVNGLSLAAITTAGEPIPVAYPISDPPPAKSDEPLTLSPGQRFSGTYYLSEKLPTLARVVRQSDVMLLWAYGFEPSVGVVTGVVIMHRQAPPPN